LFVDSARVQEFSADDVSAGGDLFNEEMTAAQEASARAEAERRKAVPGLQNPYDALGADMDDL
jgi:hypothetical protein